MIHDAAWQLQLNLIQNLTSDPQLTQIMGNSRVFDHVPRTQSLPYVTVNVARAFDWSTSTEDGGEYEVQVRAWSDYRGRKQVLEIADVVESVLSQVAFNLVNYHIVNLRVQSTQTGLELDGRTYFCVLRFRAVIERI